MIETKINQKNIEQELELSEEVKGQNPDSSQDEEAEEHSSNKLHIGGIPLEHIYENSDWIKPFQCFICTNISVSPVRCTSCSTLYCKSCLKLRVSDKQTCIKCQQNTLDLSESNISLEAELIPDLNTEQFLQDIQVDCPFKESGCTQILHYSEYEQHIKECLKRSKICLNCGENFICDQAADHQVVCPENDTNKLNYSNEQFMNIQTLKKKQKGFPLKRSSSAKNSSQKAASYFSSSTMRKNNNVEFMNDWKFDQNLDEVNTRGLQFDEQNEEQKSQDNQMDEVEERIEQDDENKVIYSKQAFGKQQGFSHSERERNPQFKFSERDQFQQQFQAKTEKRGDNNNNNSSNQIFQAVNQVGMYPNNNIIVKNGSFLVSIILSLIIALSVSFFCNFNSSQHMLGHPDKESILKQINELATIVKENSSIMKSMQPEYQIESPIIQTLQIDEFKNIIDLQGTSQKNQLESYQKELTNIFKEKLNELMEQNQEKSNKIMKELLAIKTHKEDEFNLIIEKLSLLKKDEKKENKRQNEIQDKLAHIENKMEDFFVAQKEQNNLLIAIMNNQSTNITTSQQQQYQQAQQQIFQLNSQLLANLEEQRRIQDEYHSSQQALIYQNNQKLKVNEANYTQSCENSQTALNDNINVLTAEYQINQNQTSNVIPSSIFSNIIEVDQEEGFINSQKESLLDSNVHHQEQQIVEQKQEDNKDKSPQNVEIFSNVDLIFQKQSDNHSKQETYPSLHSQKQLSTILSIPFHKSQSEFFSFETDQSNQIHTKQRLQCIESDSDFISLAIVDQSDERTTPKQINLSHKDKVVKVQIKYKKHYLQSIKFTTLSGNAFFCGKQMKNKYDKSFDIPEGYYLSSVSSVDQKKRLVLYFSLLSNTS